MNTSKYMTIVYFILGFAFAAISYYLSLQYEIGLLSRMSEVGGGVDIAADGGALGFAIISGTCFFCTAYLMKRNY